jgi:hypothetical protein
VSAKYPNNREGWSLWYLDLSEAQRRMAKTERDHADAMDQMADSSRDMGAAIANCSDDDLHLYLNKAQEIASALSGDRAWLLGGTPGGGKPPSPS